MSVGRSLGELGRRVWYLLNRRRLERDLREEMAAHRAMQQSSGPRFGNELRLREEAADVWGWAWMDRLRQDVRFGGRLLVRAPLFSITAILVLSLGVGINLAAFQILDAVAFTPLPVVSPDRLVKLTRRHPGGTSTSFAYPAFDFYRANGAPLASSFAVVNASVAIGTDETHRVEIEFVSGNYFSDLGIQPIAGRLLAPSDDRVAADAVIVLAERAWRVRFGADPALIGQRLTLNGHPFVVAGVVPDTFGGFHDHAAIGWAAVAQHPVAFPGSTLLENETDVGAVRFYARVREGVSFEQAEAALVTTVQALRAARPALARDKEWLHLTPAGRYMPLEESSAAGIALASALILLLLITACMNLGLLVLSRTLSRDREFSIRLAVGASRGRILRQIVTEQLLLAAAGTAAGVMVASVATRLFAILTELPRGIVPHMTVRSTAAAVALAALSALLFGLVPALQSIRPAIGRRMRARTVLIGVQVAAAMVLLIVSGLIVRGVTRVTNVPLGFDYKQLVLLDPDLSSHGATPEAAVAYWDGLEQRIRRLPGVSGTALASLPPLGNRVTINNDRTVIYGVSESYFTTMGIPLLRGRLFGPREATTVVVSEALARRQWPGEDPLGKSYDGSTVVGVVADARSVRIRDRSTSECYYPISRRDLATSVLIVRAAGEPGAIAEPVAAVARTYSASILPSVVMLPDALEEKIAPARQLAYVASVLGGCALLLAVVGLAGIVAFTVTQRLREIGVRVALGARPRNVLGAIARQFAWPIGAGAVGGSLLAAGVGTAMSRELFGVSQFDPLAHGGAALLFVTIAALASLPSARRAMRVDPARTLRHE